MLFLLLAATCAYVADPKDISVVLFIVLVAVCAYLVFAGKLSGGKFVAGLFPIALVVLVIHNLDVVHRFEFRGASIEFIERTRNEVFAKAEQMRFLTEQTAELITEASTTSNRFGGVEDNPSQELRTRNKLRQTLEKGGTPEARIKEILAPFAKWILFDLRYAILQSVQDLLTQKGKAGQINEFYAKTKALLEGSEPLQGLDRAVRMLHDAGLSSPRLEEDINRYRMFLTQDRIPPLTAAH